MTRILILFIGLIFNSCSSGSLPSGILPNEKLQKVVYDLIRVDEFINNYVIKDSTINVKEKRSILYEQVFKVNNTNRKEFYSSYQYYQKHPDVQKRLFDSLQQHLITRKVDSGVIKPTSTSK